jgi:phosphoglycerate dehydrogenase-like enzyme
MNALVLAPMTEEHLARLQALMPVAYESWADTRELADPEALARRIEAEGITVLVVEADFLPGEVFEQAPHLRLVAVCRNSLSHIDLAAATGHNVAVIHTPGRNAQAVAELTIGMMLILARRITSQDACVKEGRWQMPVEPYIQAHLQSGELAGKTLGILGLGNIGLKVARLAAAFEMQVLAYDPYVEASTQRFPDVTLCPTVAELASESDFLSVHVPDVPGTKGLLSRSVLAGIKPGCRIINTSSYHAVNEAALLEGLGSGRVAGAAFDVFPTHPLLPNSPLLGFDNVVLTPHIGGATRETVARHSEMIVQDIERFVQGQKPEHLVNPEVWGRFD